MAAGDKAKPLIMSGARARLLINNKLVAFSTNVNYDIFMAHQPVVVMGRYSTPRHEPVGYDVSVTCGSFRFTSTGGNNTPDASDGGFAPTLNNLVTSEELTITIEDRQTGKKMLVIEHARLTRRTGSMGARDLLTETWSFVGTIAWNDDSGQQAEGGIGPNVEAAGSF